MRDPGRRGYALVLALGVAVVLSALALGLISSEMAASANLRLGQADVARAVLVHHVRERLTMLLRVDRGLRDEVALDRDFAVARSGNSLKVRWKEGPASVHRPIPPGYANGEVLFEDERFLPEVGYHPRAQVQAFGRAELPPGHTAVAMEFPGKQGRYAAIYSNSFPYAACAPNGEVQIKSLQGFSNPTFKRQEQTPESTGFPAWVLAESRVSVESFPVGRAFSFNGPIDVRGGAVGFRVTTPRDNLPRKLAQRASELYNTLANQCLDKSDALAGQVLRPESFLRFLQGQGNLMALASAQQSTMLPLFPIPSVQSVGALKVLLLHHPWPPDFRDNTPQGELQKRLKDLIVRSEQLQKDYLVVRKRVADLYQKMQENPGHPDFGKWKREHEVEREAA